MEKVNTLVICKDNYEDEFDFQDAIRDAVMFLLKNDYIMTVRYDEKNLGIVCIDYEHGNQQYGCPYPYWLYPQHAEAIESLKESD